MRRKSSRQLFKPKIRQSWSKYNLYNLSRATSPPFRARTFFQQKWTAKSVLRAYHSEQVTEGRWVKMFRRRLKSVVPMQPEYLARNDGALESAGRGSAMEKKSGRSRPKATPYMQMTFAPLERRLDTAVFRALFASSARQARQFVVHGAVTVNGKKMRHPGYLLNPGDLFQVEPEHVMFATGAPKSSSDALSQNVVQDKRKNQEQGSIEAASDDQLEDTSESKEQENEDEKKEDAEKEDPRETLRSLLSQAKSVLGSSKEKGLSAKRKQEIRGFSKQIKRQLSRSRSSTIMTDSLEAQFLELKNQLLRPAEQLPSDQSASSSDVSSQTQTSGITPDSLTIDDTTSSSSSSSPSKSQSQNSDSDSNIRVSTSDLSLLRLALERLKANPVDPSKPYATPWTPRPYMSAFAFIPRYLEVNPAICAAVYLRHPVARPGLGEVPTPFGVGTSGEAFNWYLRRR